MHTLKEKIQALIRFHTIRLWYKKYERFLMPATLVLGVCVDWFTFASVDIAFSCLLLGIYLVLAGGVIAFVAAYDARRISHSYSIFRYLYLSSPLLLQFLFGALLSNVFIFYFFSGTVFVSWPFIAAVVVLMISNDVFRHYFLRPVVQLSVYFFVLFSVLSVVLPFVFNALEVWVFVVSGGLSVFVMGIFVWVVLFFSKDLRKEKISLLVALVTIFVVLNAMYFLNVIPPIPLSIREATVSHGVERAGTEYILHVEPQSFWDRVVPGQVFHRAPGESVSVYTAIFAPGKLRTRVVHHWQWYDRARREWVSMNRLGFEVTGGRREGFRGYSTKSVVPSGKWRVDVETERGQVLGRVGFEVVGVGSGVGLVEVGR